jgi:hypothetical protein
MRPVPITIVVRAATTSDPALRMSRGETISTCRPCSFISWCRARAVLGSRLAYKRAGRRMRSARSSSEYMWIDPMTNSTEWGLRSYQDRPDATSWGGQNVLDVYTKSEGTALDGTKYRDW